MTKRTLFILSMAAAFICLTRSPRALADDLNTAHVHTTTTTTVTSDGVQPPPQAPPQAPPIVPVQMPERESVVTAKFGSRSQSGTAGCKTEELASDLIKDLKGDCNAWIKDQKANLKDRFLTSTCEESCDDCGMGLKRCLVNGTIHFLMR